MKSSHIVLSIAIIAVAVLVGIEMTDDPTLGESLENASDSIANSIEDAGEKDSSVENFIESSGN
jgi:archaellum component FlaG (FlaF/FlaG flagellin family)